MGHVLDFFRICTVFAIVIIIHSLDGYVMNNSTKNYLPIYRVLRLGTSIFLEMIPCFKPRKIFF